jgi:hypothetical protein
MKQSWEINDEAQEQNCFCHRRFTAGSVREREMAINRATSVIATSTA